jgi:chemotaxis protein MotB
MYSRLILALIWAVVAAGCVSEPTYNAEVATANKAQAQAMDYQALNQKLTTELGADNAQIQTLENQLKVTIENSVLFPEGGYELSAKGQATLAKVAPTLSNLPGQQIVVQGFTDNVPIGPHLKAKFPSNLELSSARADNVVEFLERKGVPQTAISAQGFGEERPVATNDTPEGRAQNRRVEIIIKSQALK